MHKQSNTPLYVLGGCVLAIAVIVAVVRANTPPEDKTAKPRSALADLQLTGLGEAPADMPSSAAPAGSNERGRVQMLPITVEGKQGLLVRYQTEVLLEPIQQRMAQNILSKVKSQAEKAGVEVIVIMAVGPSGGDMDSPLAAQTHTIAYKRLVDGTWVEMEDPSLSDSAEPDGFESPPSASGSAAKPAGSNVPLFITH